MSQAVTVRHEGPVWIVLLNRPAQRNAVDGPTAQALAEAFRAFEAQDDASVAVLHGEGGVFCAGADLKAVGTPDGNRIAPDGDGPMGPTRMRLSKPVIAAIAGHAVAGGLELALWCDLRVAEEDAVLGVFCRRWGVPLIDGGTVRLPRLIGASRAMDMILTGRAVPAEEAERIGLVNRLVPPGQSLPAAHRARPVAGPLPTALPARGPAVGRSSRRASTSSEALGNRVRAWAPLAEPRSRRASNGSAPARGGTASSIDRAAAPPRPRAGRRGQRSGRRRARSRRATWGRRARPPTVRRSSSWASSIQASGRDGPGKAVDRVQLPVPAVEPAPAGAKLRWGRPAGRPERERQVLVGLLLPAAAPGQLEALGQREQTLAGCRATGNGSIPSTVMNRPSGRPCGVEAEQRDHAVDVDQQQRRAVRFTTTGSLSHA